jgi:NAD(P)-dependent dehydrogenase (short-subunit alcohol dehydrogenase family)
MKDSIQKIMLACRSEAKAKAAKAQLEAATGRKIFEIVLMDVMKPDTVRAAVAKLEAPIDAVVLNAGGSGGTTPFAKTSDGVSHIFAVNVLGHVVLVDELLERQLLTSTVLYAGSEAARGIPKMGMPVPEMKESSVSEYASVIDGSKFRDKPDPMVAYGYVKLQAAMWMASMARQHPHIRFVTMSPGGTTGTAGFDDLPFIKRLFFKHVGGVLMPRLGMMHKIETGANRYVDGLLNPEFKSGKFYASKGKFPTGPVVDQESLAASLGNRDFQDNANMAVRRFI